MSLSRDRERDLRLWRKVSLPKQVREKASSQRDDHHATQRAYSKITMQRAGTQMHACQVCYSDVH